MNREEIVALTREYGGDWAVNHAERLLQLIEVIAADRSYHAEAVWVAAYLHDWGGYPKWAVPGVDHGLRSRQVAEPFLAERGCPADQAAVILEAIEFHHGGRPDRSFESLLLTDADALDLIGAVGVVRAFVMKGRDLRGGFEMARQYLDLSSKVILLDRSRQLAARRRTEAERLLREFEEETRGVF